MVPLLPIFRSRRRRKVAERRSTLPRLARAILAIYMVSVVVILGGFTLAYSFVTHDLPPLSILPRAIEPPDGMIFHPTEIYDRSGKNLLIRLENPAARGRQYLPYDEDMPEHLPVILGTAAVAVTDPDFWHHPGITWQSVRSPNPVTIAERLVDQFLLKDEPPGLLKGIQQKWLALQITSQFGKERILEWYLNSANFGRLAYGADAAARVYFGKPASQLNLAEAALLATLSDTPALNPIDSPKAAQERQKEILTLIQEKGLITPADAQMALATDLTIQKSLEWPVDHTSVFTQYAIRQMVDLMGWERLERGGLEVITTLDLSLQEQAFCTSQIHLNQLAGNTKASAASVTPCEAARLLPTLPSSISTDSASGLAVDLAIVDIKTGQILALYSQHPPGRETSLHDGRPAGSLLTPLVALAGFTRGYTPATLVWDIPEQYSADPIPHYGKTYDGAMRLRNALVNDILSPSVEIYRQIGPEDIRRHFGQLGISFDGADAEEPATVLWRGANFKLLELLQAYSTIANQGALTGQDFSNPSALEKGKSTVDLHPSAILKVTEADHRTWLDWGNPQTKAVLTPQLAYLITNILGDESMRWKSLGHPNPLEIGRPAGVKIGRTLAGKDAWTIGYTPELATAVWIGSPEGGATLPEMAAAPLWNAMVRYALQDTAILSWNPPDGVHAVQVCDPSGMLPTPHCPNIVREVFIRGTEPTQADTFFYPVQIDRETGRLATTFTDFDTIEEKTFLHLPLKALPWVQQMGFTLPPVIYDTLHALQDTDPKVKLDKPAQYAILRGMVEIHGSADIEHFSFYRLKTGQGLNPSSWLNIGETGKAPVHDGKLADWDTNGLNGLYVLELTVADVQNRITTTSRLVTVDNRPPMLDILSPRPGQIMETIPGKDIIFQVSAKDDIQLARITFSIGGQEIGSITHQPYVFFWKAEPGSYNLDVSAWDAAGNQQHKRVDFIVIKNH